MPDNGLNRRLITLAVALAAVIIIGVAVVATRQTQVPVSSDTLIGAQTPSTAPTQSKFGEIAWHESPAPAPTTVFRDGAGAEVSLEAFGGKVLVVNFWATWCAPCIKEMPMLDALQAKLGGPEFEVLAISQDREGALVATPFMDTNKWTNLERYTEPAARFAKDASLRGLPTSLVIDKSGNEVGRVEGDTDWTSSDIEQSLRDLIGTL